MTKITIREVDETTIGNVVIESTDVVYVPGFSVLAPTDDSVIGEPHVPVLCKTISEFETYFGASTPTFSSNQVYPDGFNGLAIPTDIGGTPRYMFKKDEPDPSYIYAKELIASGLPVLYERINEFGETIEVSKMYSRLGTVFSKNVDANISSIVSFAPPYDSTTSYTAGMYCSYESRNYKANAATTGTWDSSKWDLATDYSNFTVVVSSKYTFYEKFNDTGKYEFTYSNYPIIGLNYNAQLASKMALEYDPALTYNQDSHCTYAGNVFTCLTQTTGPFDSTAWEYTPNFNPSANITFDQDKWLSSFPVDNSNYVFTYVVDTTSGWTITTLSGQEPIDIETLGIYATGTFADGDEITINNGYQTGWVLSKDNKLYNISSCGITVTPIPNRSVRIGDKFTIYLESTDALLIDRGLYSFKYLTTGGYPVYEYDSNSIGKQMAKLCYTRGDAVALIDHTDNPDRALTGMTSVYFSVCNDTSNSIPSAYQSFAAMFTPAVEMGLINTYRGWSWVDSLMVKLPSTCVLPASFAYLSCLASSIKVFPNWNAIAGATRGKVTGLVAPRTVKALTNAIADSFTPDTATAINPITNIKPYGQCIWGNRTLVDNSIKQGTTATSFLNIRNLVSDVKKQLFVACQSLLFEQNTDILWVNFLSLVTPILDKMVSGFGIHTYKIIKLPNSDKTQINVKIRLYPIYAVESFDITIYLNDKGVYLDGEE